MANPTAAEDVRLTLPERIAACLLAGITAAFIAYVNT